MNSGLLNSCVSKIKIVLPPSCSAALSTTVVIVALTAVVIALTNVVVALIAVSINARRWKIVFGLQPIVIVRRQLVSRNQISLLVF
jgi:hypothetical protein